MSFVNVTSAADAAGAWAPGVIDEASSAQARALRKPMARSQTVGRHHDLPDLGLPRRAQGGNIV